MGGPSICGAGSIALEPSAIANRIARLLERSSDTNCHGPAETQTWYVRHSRHVPQIFGLACVLEYENRSRFIFNPATGKEINKVDGILWDDNGFPHLSSMGIGFCVSSQHYKMVHVSGYISLTGTYESKIEVVTLGTVEKRIIAAGIFPFVVYGNPVFLNDAFHWIPLTENGLKVHIVSFSLDSDKIEELPTPKLKEPFSNKSGHYQLGVLRGCLSIADCSRDDVVIDIWIMKEYNVKESWTKLYSAIYVHLISMEFPVSLLSLYVTERMVKFCCSFVSAVSHYFLTTLKVEISWKLKFQWYFLDYLGY
ncbi:hypothetical protein GIB67_033990 [Kingdonia uniflora]|uniref:F-box associated domain-containing protein n=1 Tax=Kingdonia uniflora TaxID=39325 RepID=A0A7J7M5W6_9MAGN|nr:hypothetical protein GIB67_033990 [Kingdonia uniflora]